MRSFLDFDYVNLALTPMFLFSATFFPLDQYPSGVATVVRLTPLYQGVALCRALTTGEVHPGLLLHVAYLALFAVVGVAVAGRRIDQLLRR
jgi:lipooligosaccharide transport system permease protein